MSVSEARYVVRGDSPGWVRLSMNDTAARNVMEILRTYGNDFAKRVADDIKATLPKATVEHLCVGGPRHGAKVNLAMGATDYKFPVEVDIAATEFAPAQEQVLMVDLYVLVTIYVDGRSMKVLAYRNRS